MTFGFILLECFYLLGFKCTGTILSKSRREFLTICSAAGVGSTFFAGTLYAVAAEKPEEKMTAEMIDQAAALAGIEHFSPTR